jgi:hypothetical protein
MRKLFLLFCLLFASMSSTVAQVNFGFGVSIPGLSIGLNMPMYPQLVRVPGYPVYYAPQQTSNYFFYDGMYWVYQDNNWYTSAWYNGPWEYVEPEFVPLFVLRIPISYYRNPPTYFLRWRRDAAPRWGEHWGNDWEQQRRGWDQWNRRQAPPPAPLPIYQRRFTGDRYPGVDQQHLIHDQQYRFKPRDTSLQQRQEQLLERQRQQQTPTAHRDVPPNQQRPQGAPSEPRARIRDTVIQQPGQPQHRDARPAQQAPQAARRTPQITPDDAQRAVPTQAPRQQAPQAAPRAPQITPDDAQRAAPAQAPRQQAPAAKDDNRGRQGQRKAPDQGDRERGN